MVEVASISHQGVAEDLSSLSIHNPDSTRPAGSLEPPSSIAGTENAPSHRSHDPINNLKRSDPFKFGSRYLEENDNVFEFNAWDHVVPDASHYEYAESQYDFQRANPVSEFDKKRFNDQPEKWWNKFYSNNTSNFFKDRKWLHQEFPLLSQLTKADSPPAVVLEVGAGAGNTAFPILKANENPHLMLHACDFSSKAVELMKANECYDPTHIDASVWDIASDDLPHGVMASSVDVVLLVFIFSALNPKQWDVAVRNVRRVLKPGGEVCFRDYGKGDLTQVRFKKGRLMDENFYIRGDGTRVYFFEEQELRRIWESAEPGLCDIDDKVKEPGTNEIIPENTETAYQPNGEDAKRESDTSGSATESPAMQHSTSGFDILSLGVDRRMLVNRQKQLKMYRCWIQGRFRKPTEPRKLSKV